MLCCGDIHHRSDKSYEVARLVQDGMSDSMKVLDGSVGKNNAVVRFIVCFLLENTSLKPPLWNPLIS